MIEDNNKETCAVCGKITDVDINQHVSKREFFVEGCGQLCCKCYVEVFGRYLHKSDKMLR